MFWAQCPVYWKFALIHECWGKVFGTRELFSIAVAISKNPWKTLMLFPLKIMMRILLCPYPAFLLKTLNSGPQDNFFKPILKGNAREYSVSIICLMPGIEWSVWGNFPIGQNCDSITLFFIIPYKPRSIGRRALKLSLTLLWSSKRTLKNISLSGIHAIISYLVNNC